MRKKQITNRGWVRREQKRGVAEVEDRKHKRNKLSVERENV
jgi:hypothetical protein